MSETEHWIVAIEEAIRTRTKLPMMQGSERFEIVMLMYRNGRHDLASMAHHVIPIDRSKARRMSALEFVEEMQRLKGA